MNCKVWWKLILEHSHCNFLPVVVLLFGAIGVGASFVVRSLDGTVLQVSEERNILLFSKHATQNTSWIP